MVQVTGSKEQINIKYGLHGQILETLTCAKYLGVDILYWLVLDSHVDKITVHANKTGFIRRNIKTKDTGL